VGARRGGAEAGRGASGIAYEIDAGEGAFYGPKIDVHARDAIGREWQLSTIQVDFNLPQRFDVAYAGRTAPRTGRTWSTARCSARSSGSSR
jgi:threonyl-tRNA synthetase